MANTLTSHQATIVAQDALLFLRKNTVMPKLITTAFGSEAQKEGSSIKIPKIGALTTNAKVAGSNVTVQNATSTAATITLDQHRETTFIIEDIDTAISSGNLSEFYLDSAMSAMCEKVDADICGLYAGLSQTVAGSANGTAITNAILVAGRKQLSDAKAPKADRSLVVGTEAYAQLIALDSFISAEKYGSNAPIMEGELGKIYGFKVFESQSIVTAVADQNLMFHKRAFGLAVRPLPLEAKGDAVQVIVADESGLSLRVTMWYNPLALGMQVTVDLLYGFAELDDSLATKLLS